MKVRKWALTSVDSWVELESLPGALPNRAFDGWQAWRLPDAALGPGGGVPQAFLRWGLWGLALLGLKQIAVSLVWNGSLENGVRFGIWYPALFGLCSLIILRSQPAYSAFFAVVGSTWCFLEGVSGWLQNFPLIPYVAACLFLMLAIEWRAELGRLRMTVYGLGFALSAIVFPALFVAGVMTDRYFERAWYLFIVALFVHTERCFRLGLRRTVRAAFIVGASTLFGVTGGIAIVFYGRDFVETGVHLVAYSLLTFMPVGCLLFEWAHRRRIREQWMR